MEPNGGRVEGGHRADDRDDEDPGPGKPRFRYRSGTWHGHIPETVGGQSGPVLTIKEYLNLQVSGEVEKMHRSVV